jgi:hypothetical protein
MIETKFDISGTTLNVVKIDTNSLEHRVPNKVYTVKYDDRANEYHLGLVQDNYKENLPKKMYGVQGRQSKIITTFKDRKKPTGVLLSGDSGVGKTQLMIGIAEELREEGLPIILVESAFYGEVFNDFISSLGVCVILFDEFGKIYDDYQENLLSLLDGTTSSKKLYIFTENDSRAINNYILNRPGRAYYHFEYTKLEIEVVNEYLAETSITDINREDLLEYYSKVDRFSFDSLQAIVSQCTRFPEDSVEIVLKELNVPIPRDEGATYKVIKLLKNGKDIIKKVTSVDIERDDASLYIKKGKEQYYHIRFTAKKDTGTGEMSYRAKDKNSVYDMTVVEEIVSVWSY